MDPPGNRGRIRSLQLQRVVVDKRFGRLDQRHIARQTTVIPPVGIQRGHAIPLPLIVDVDHHEIVAVVHQAGDLAVERSESALVFASFLPVHEHAEPHSWRRRREGTYGCWLALILEVLLVPDRAFVEEQRVTLRIPIAGNLQRRRLGEVVLDQLVACPGLLVEKVAIGSRLHAEVVVPVVVGIDDRMPVAVETDGRAIVRINQAGSACRPPRTKVPAEAQGTIRRSSSESLCSMSRSLPLQTKSRPRHGFCIAVAGGSFRSITPSACSGKRS